MEVDQVIDKMRSKDSSQELKALQDAAIKYASAVKNAAPVVEELVSDAMDAESRKQLAKIYKQLTGEWPEALSDEELRIWAEDSGVSGDFKAVKKK